MDNLEVLGWLLGQLAGVASVVMVIVDVIQTLNAVKWHAWEHVIQSLLLLLLDDSLKHLQALC